MSCFAMGAYTTCSCTCMCIGIDREIKKVTLLFVCVFVCVWQVFDKQELVECIRQLVKVDEEWVPYSTTSTLYIRPTMIATEVS